MRIPALAVTAVLVLASGLPSPARAQTSSPEIEPAPAGLSQATQPEITPPQTTLPQTSGLPGTFPAPAAAAESPALKLYRELRDVSLDPDQVYKIREAYLDINDIHISLNDGVIGFTKAVEGRITGAYFQGNGEILLMPPDNVERSSLALHTGSAVLEEEFRSGFFRFNDATAAQLRSALRAKEDGAEFVSEYSPFIGRIAEQDALRLLASFLRSPSASSPDRMFRARLDGVKLGIFDVVLDTLAEEQIGVGRFARSGETIYYDLIASFPMRSVRKAAAQNEGSSTQDISSGMLGSLRVHNYVVRARIEPPHTLNAKATLDTEITASGERVLFLELSRYLKVRSVEADGRAIEFLQNEALEGSALARRGNDLVALIFPQPLRQGQEIHLKFDYAGPVLSEAGGGLISVGARGIWYPNHGRAMANFDLEFRSPKEWTLVATGKRVSQRTEGTEEISHWVSDRPIPVAGFNLGEYTLETAKAGDIAIEVYAAQGVEKQFPAIPPPITAEALTGPPVQPRPQEVAHFAGRGRSLPDVQFLDPPMVMPTPEPNRSSARVAQEASEMIEFMTKHAGPFPYSSLMISQRPGPISQGWPGLVYLSSYAFLSPQERTALKLPPYESIMLGGLMTRHEVAHQWWGDLVGWKSYRDQWLVEALSTYSALLSIEKDDPKQFQAMLDIFRDELESENSDHEKRLMAGPVTLGLRLSSSRFPNGFDTVSYGRGTWLLHMLRHLLRDAYAGNVSGLAQSASMKRGGNQNPDEPFFRLLHRLREEYAGKDLSTADLQKAAEAELPDSYRFERRKSLDWFFQGWVNGTAIPRLDMDNVKLSRKSNEIVASGALIQKDAPDNLITSVPIYASDGKNLTLLGRVFADGKNTSFELKAPLTTRKLVLDPYETVLRER